MTEFWPYIVASGDVRNSLIVAIGYVTISLMASAHAVLYKRDTRAAIAWVGIVWLVPFLGALLYIWLGINRIQRRAQSLRAKQPPPESQSQTSPCSQDLLQETLGLVYDLQEDRIEMTEQWSRHCPQNLRRDVARAGSQKDAQRRLNILSLHVPSR